MLNEQTARHKVSKIMLAFLISTFKPEWNNLFLKHNYWHTENQVMKALWFVPKVFSLLKKNCNKT